MVVFGGVVLRIYLNYEMGISELGVRILVNWYEVGVDVMYLVMG